MSGALDRRLIALERASGARGLDIRTFATVAEADRDAAANPPGPGVEVLRIVTGVPRRGSAERMTR
jgi:hypothetical protein